MRGVIPDQLVCTKCWKWYDGRNLCPTCREPLVSPDTGRPLPEVEASPSGVTPADAPPARWAGAEVPPLAGEAFVEAPLPKISGYPTGTPATAPTRREFRHYLAGDPLAGAAAPGPLAARLALPLPAPGVVPAPSEELAPPVPPPQAGPPPGTPAPGPRPWVSPLGPPLPSPSGTPSPGLGGAPAAATWAVRPPGSPAWPPSPVGPGGPPGGRVPPAPGPGPRSLGADAPTAPPGRTEALPLGWHPGVSLGRPLAAAPSSADPQAPGSPLPASRPLPASPPPAPPYPPSWSVTQRTPDRPPAPPVAPPPAPPAPVWPGVATVAECPIAAPPSMEAPPRLVPAPPPPPPPAWPLEAWPPPVRSAGAATASPAAAPAAPPSVGKPSASPPPAASWSTVTIPGPAPVAPDAVHTPASPEFPEPPPPPPPPPPAAGPAASPSTTATSTHETRLLPAVLVALVVSLAVAALWVAAAVQTDQVLPELAIVVGVASGLVIRRSARRGGFGAALSAVVIALVAIAVGLALAALAIHSAGEGITLQTGLQTFTSSLLPQLRDEVGLTGAALGVAGVVVAGLLTLRRD